MFKQMYALMSQKGRLNAVLSSLFYTLYGISSAAMLVTIIFVMSLLLKGQSFASCLPWFVLLAALTIGKGLLNMFGDQCKHNAGFDIVQQIRQKMVRKLKTFSLSFYTDARLGEINTVLHKDVDNMSLVLGHTWPRVLAEFLVALFVFVVLAFWHIGVSLVMLLSVVPALLYLRYAIHASFENQQKNSLALADMVSRFVDFVRGLPVLKSFATQPKLETQLNEAVQRFEATSRTNSRTKSREIALYEVLLDLGYIVFLATLTLVCVMGSLTPLAFVVIAVVAREFYKPFAAMELDYVYFIMAKDSYTRLMRILGGASIADNKSGPVPEHHTIAFDRVNFTYPTQPGKDPGQPSLTEQTPFKLQDLSFTIPENRITALVGGSGSGKSTIGNLLLRFYDVQGGAITLGGKDIRQIPYDELLDKVSVVMQKVQLFDDTVKANVAVGKRGADDNDVIRACKQARIHDFIMSLPRQYDTPIGENGSLLSGGQRQRLAIARAFLKDAPLLILDEMTSNVDPINEALIQEALSELAKGRTVIVIAHHLKTIQNADQILVFDNGDLVESGKHADLLALKGRYYALWQAQ